MISGSVQPWRNVLSGASSGLLARIARPLLWCGSVCYRGPLWMRQGAYDLGLIKTRRLARPVLSVGNLTAGGTGKTPMVMELVRRLQAQGCRPAVLLRGYKGTAARSAESMHAGPPPPRRNSDEQALYESVFGGATPVAADPDRVRSAAWVTHHVPETNLFVLDDGFQHRRVVRQFDLVLIDATCPFGYGHLLPRGLLREPVEGLQRADGLVITRADEVDAGELSAIRRELERLAPGIEVVTAGHRWTMLLDEEGNQHPLGRAAEINPIGICGIANPDSFAASLRKHSGRDHVPVRALPDHHHYSLAELRRWLDEAAECEQVVVTTEKDWVKIAPMLGRITHRPPIYRPRLAIEFIDGEPRLDEWVRQMAELALSEASKRQGT